MPGITRVLGGSYVGAVITGPGTEQGVAYCENCLKVGILSRLKNRLYLDDKGKALPPPPDFEDWLQCWKCGDIIPTREAKKEGTISGISGVEPIDNAHDFGKPEIIKGLDDRKQRHQKVKRKQSRKKLDDAEVQKELDRGSELVRYIKTTN